MLELSPVTAIQSRRIVTPEGIIEGCILTEGGIIEEIVPRGSVPPGAVVEDAGNSVVMPGLVDTHVHINEPGRTDWEGFETATKAAAAGGITTLVDMPLNSTPVTTTPGAFRMKLASADGKLYVDCGFYAGLIPGNSGEIESLIAAGVLGVKAFLIHSGIDDFPNATESDLRAAMPAISRGSIPLLVHCELQGSATAAQSSSEDPGGNGKKSTQLDPRSYREYLSSRPRRWEHDAIELMIRLCREYSCKVHIVHVSSADAVPILEKARTSGLPLTTETCPHYLFFASEGIPDGDTRFKCAPPIREAENRERLWNGLKRGVLDFIVSDHSPSLPALKYLTEGDFQRAWGGIASLQLGLPIIWTEAMQRRHTLNEVAGWMCTKPAEFAGLGAMKGKIAPGYQADLVIWNPEKEFTVGPSMLFHKHRVTPYEGRTLRGVVERTFLRGRKIYEQGFFYGGPAGRVVLRNP